MLKQVNFFFCKEQVTRLDLGISSRLLSAFEHQDPAASAAGLLVELSFPQ